jgi:Esterase/lipase
LKTESEIYHRLSTKIYLILICCCFAADMIDAQKKIKLWNGDPPESNGITEKESVRDGYFVMNVTEAELEIYLPESNTRTGMAVVICPGGGYSGLAYTHEGVMVAEWLNKEGIAAFILKYRMPNKNKNIPLSDAQQAIRHIREHAAEYGVNTTKIGICGFSAGGHLASTASTHFTIYGTSTRPDFSILFYPVITMTELTHGGSRNNLLGNNPSEVDRHMFSNEKHVNENTPPAILLLSDDDKSVLPENSIRYYEALKRNSIPATMYVFPCGGHGWGFKEEFEYHKQMKDLLSKWLKAL